jgi:hypothetical protein
VEHWLRGFAFALLPFVVAMLLQSLVVLQAERSVTAWLVAGLGEAIRWGVYGVLMGLTYPVLRTRRLLAPHDPSTDPAYLAVEPGN